MRSRSRSKRRSSPQKMKSTKFESVNQRRERMAVTSVPRRRFSKSKRPPTRPPVDTDLEKARGGLICVDAGGRQQANDAVWFDQVHGAFNE